MIVGDIGGTKTLLAYIDQVNTVKAELPTLQHLKRYDNDEHDCFDGILTSYFMETGLERPNTLVLSVAGPISNNQCQMTNLPWALDTNKLAEEFSIPHVHLINDLAATAYSIPVLPDSDFTWLQPYPVNAIETQSVISAGTGLGEASLVYSFQEQRYTVVPGEGGHKNFAPSNDEELALLTFYLKKNQHVSIETLISGDGLQRIYAFLQQHPDWNKDIPRMEDADSSNNLNQLITQLAFELPGSIYEKTVLMFSKMLMSEAGNLALQTYSNGGVVIAGGIPPKITQFLQKQECIAAFCNKGRFRPWLQGLPLRICLNTQAPLFGAWVYGQQIE